jgi:hypothetical protein
MKFIFTFIGVSTSHFLWLHDQVKLLLVTLSSQIVVEIAKLCYVLVVAKFVHLLFKQKNLVGSPLVHLYI